jgi:hypothetical protein
MTAHLTSTTDQAAKAYFRAVFDALVFNFGDYNILVANGIESRSEETFIIGYRPAPREILICEGFRGWNPQDGAFEKARVVQISDMDVSQAIVDVDAQSVGMITTRGETFEFRVNRTASAEVDGDALPLDQSDDVADFLEFMRIFVGEMA